MPVVQVNEPCNGCDDPSRSLLPQSLAARYKTEAIELGPGTSPSLHSGGEGDGAWMDYIGWVRQELERLHPRVVIIRGARLLGALAGLRRQPALAVYEAIDCAPFHHAWVAQAAHCGVVKVDVALYREELSAAAEMDLCRRGAVPSRIVYPCAALPSDENEPASSDGPTPAIWFDEGRVFERFAGDGSLSAVGDLPIQFGDAAAEPGSPPRNDWRKAAFRFVGREPCCEYGRNVATPAFFASIAANVPVIAAPHRQLQEFVGRYGCGIVMDAWTPGAFRRVMETALGLCRTTSYDELVASCHRACRRELNWTTQFGKVTGVLPAP